MVVKLFQATFLTSNLFKFFQVLSNILRQLSFSFVQDAKNINVNYKIIIFT